MRKLKLFFACLLMAVLSIGQMWASVLPTEDFEKQSAGSTYNSQISYDADDSNAGMAWYVEHGTVSTNSKLSGDKSMQMRGYYQANSSTTAWNGALPYLESKTAVAGLQSITLKIAAAATFKIDFMYREDGSSTWAAMKTTAETPVDATNLSFSTTTATVTYNIPSSNPTKSYFVKIVANSSSTHANKPSKNGNIAIRVDDVVFTYDAGGTEKPTLSMSPAASGNFVGSQEITLSTTTDGAIIHYTTDGTTPTSSSPSSPLTFTITETTTVSAIAIKGSSESDVISRTFTKLTPKTTMDQIFAAATAAGNTAADVAITFDNWVISGISAVGSSAYKQAYLTDGTKGLIIFDKDATSTNPVGGFEVGDVLSGTVLCKVQLYNGASELTQLSSSTSGLSVTKGGSVSAVELDAQGIADLSGVNTGSLIKISGQCSSNNSKYYIAEVQLYNVLYSFSVTAGSEYDCTGVYIYFKKGDADAVNEIAPRSADDIEESQAATLTEVDGLAELKAEAVNNAYLVNLTNAVVTYVNGNNAFIEDATAGALIYFSSHGFKEGDCLNGKYQVTTTNFQGKFEITAMEAQTGAATTTAEIPLTTVSIATLNANFSSYESRRVKIVGANVTDAISGDDRNGAINDGAAVAVYAAAGKNVITLTADDNVDIIGYPGYYNTDKQLNVWATADITVNEKENPELAYNPTVVNVLLSDLVSFTPADLEYATGFDGVAAITYESSDPSIATVGETTGVVEVVATAEGSATITASFPGNATYKVDNASYTINVSATPITPVYTMSFDMTRASYDAAADAQVVWNSSVVTMTADKNDGTKVTNYLAGNYSGTTLIEETRFYAKNSISFVPQSGVTITKIEWMSTAKGYATKLAAETFVNATAVVDGTDDKLVIITPSAAGEISVTLTDAARATGVTVYYEAESEKAKLAASIAIANINTAVGEDDILLSNIAATSNPNKKAISYAITSGAAVSIVGEGKDAAFHALAEGTATITATIPNDLGNYTGATTTFDIIVAAAPATLVSIAISGEATALEYTEGQDFNPAGLGVTGHYSDNTDAEITDGITWAFDPSPLTQGTTSVSVTATVSGKTSDAVVVNGLTVSAAPVPVADNVVILATYGTKLYAMSTTLSSSAFTAIEVEEDGSNIVVPSAEAKAAIQWTRTTTGENTTFQDADSKYMAGGTGNTNMSLADDPCNWGWNSTNSYYFIGTRSFFYYKSGVFKNYSINNAGGDDYSGFAEVRVIAAENIVVSSKVDPELAYDPEELEIEAADIASWSAPVLGYATGFDGLADIEYASDNESVATVEGGVIALVGGYGTAVITATFGGNTNYLAGSATYTITVNAPAPTPTGTTYTKVTSTGEITDGEYLIVYEAESVAFNGDLTTLDAANNTVSVVISGDEIAGTTAIDAAVFTIDVANGTLRAHMGDYIGVTSYGNGLKQNANAETYPAHSFSIDGDGNAVISLNDSWTAAMILNYNKGVSDKRFRYYKSASPQQSIQLYKKGAAPEPTPDYTRTVEINRYGTICLPNGGTIEGAKLYDIDYYDGTSTLYLLEVNGNAMVAGRPYIFLPSATLLEVFYTDEANASAGTYRGLVGSYSEETITADAGNYILYENAYYLVNSTARVGENRAYIHMASVPTTPYQQQGAPRRRVAMNVYNEQTTTDIDVLNASETPVKMIIDGQLFIIRGEKMFDATGRLVK